MQTRKIRAFLLFFVLSLSLAQLISSLKQPAWALSQQNTLASVASDGTLGNGTSYYPSISADGRYVSFYSQASNLVANDTNESEDIFVHDLATGETTRVSVASDGTEGNYWSLGNDISADGRYVVFCSIASNLVVNDTNETYDVFVHDRTTGETERVSIASDGTQANETSWSSFPSISADGRYVAFESGATNLIPNDTNGLSDVFVHDRIMGETIRISVASDGTEGNYGAFYSNISADGHYVAFSSDSTNLVANDTNERPDVFVHDLTIGETLLISVASDGTQADHSSTHPSISADGRYVAFQSYATNLVPKPWIWPGIPDIFVHDRLTGDTTLVSLASDGTWANWTSTNPSISADGRYVTFESEATNLVPNDTNAYVDVFVHDRTTSETTLVSLASDGTQANRTSTYPSISADGRYVAFQSEAGNLVPNDTNNYVDVFVHDRYWEIDVPELIYLPFIVNP
jgi:Tol biopolymer transport system component